MTRSAFTPIAVRFLLIIFLLAISYRVIGHHFLGEHALLTNPVVDAKYHHDWAQRISNGEWLGNGPDAVFKPPLYSYVLAGVYKISDKNITVMQFFQLLLGSFSCVLIAVIASRLINRRTGIIAGCLSAFYAPFLFFELQLLTPALSIFLNLSAFFFFTHHIKNNERLLKKEAIVAGVLFGLSACVRPDVLLPVFLLGLFIIFRQKEMHLPEKIGRYCLFIFMIIVMVSPVTLRNYYLTGEFIPVSSNAGINFYIGNRTGADGISAIPVGLRWERLVSSVPQHILENPSAAGRLWTQRTLAEIRKDPKTAWKRVGRKALAFFNFQEFRNNISYHFMQQTSFLLRPPFFQYALVLSLGLVGMLGLVQQRKQYDAPWAMIGIWTGGFFLAGLLFFVNARFRLPAIPFVIISAAFCVDAVLSDIKQKNVKSFSFKLLLFLGAMVLVTHAWFPPPEKNWTRDYVNSGNAFQSAGRYQPAEAAFRSALKIKSDPDAHFMLARIHYGKRQYDRALEHATRALITLPDSPDLLLLQARIYLAMGKKTDAKTALHHLLDLADTRNLHPKKNEWAQAHILLADLDPATGDRHWQQAWQISPVTAAEMSFIRGKDNAAVLKIFKKAALTTPWDWYPQANYGMALLRAGRFQQAGVFLEKALKMAPQKKGLKKYLYQARSRQHR